MSQSEGHVEHGTFTLQNDLLAAQTAELIRNGASIDWQYWVQVEPNAQQAARLAHFIDPIKWPGDTFAQGEIPADLREKIARLEQWIEQKWPFPTITLGQLVRKLGDMASATLRDAAAPEMAALQASREAMAEQEMARHAAGLYSLEEVAEALAGKIDFQRWLTTIEDAVMRRELPLRNPQNYDDRLPYDAPKVLRTFYDQVHYDAVNRWLEAHPEWTDERLDRWDPELSEAQRGAAPALRGLTKSEMLVADWPVDINRLKMRPALTDVPEWLKRARVTQGKPGKRSSTWDPATFGMLLCCRKLASKKAIGRHIAKHFPDWFDEWEGYSEQLE